MGKSSETAENEMNFLPSSLDFEPNAVSVVKRAAVQGCFEGSSAAGYQTHVKHCHLAGYAPACFCTSAQAQLSWWAAYRAPPHSRHACLLTVQPCFPQSVVVIL